MSSGGELIRAERSRQILEEGFTHAHDDHHADGALACAADCYLYLTGTVKAPADMQFLLWPWHPSWYKPTSDPIRNLVKAGALYVAEAERLERRGQRDEAEAARARVLTIAAEIDVRLGLRPPEGTAS